MDSTSDTSADPDPGRQLQAARARTDGVLAGMSEGLVILDHAFRVVAINAEGLRLENRDTSEIVGKTHWEAWPGSETSELGRLYKEAIRDRVPVSLNHHFTWPDGNAAWLEMRAFPTEEGLAIFYRDVSARKRAESQLVVARARAEASAAEHAAILRQLAEGVIVADASGRITLVNQAAADIHGVEQIGVEPKDYSETYHLFTEDGQPYDPEALPLARAVRGETVKDARWRIRRSDGRDVLAIGSAQPLRDQDGAQVGAVLTLRDDTAREAAERSHRESEARLRALTDNLPLGAVFQLVTSRDGLRRRFQYMSQSYERLTGQSVEAVLADSKAARDLILPEDLAAFAKAEAAVLANRSAFDVEARFRRADTGEIRWRRTLSASREIGDDMLIWDGIQIDTTDQKRAEAALRDLNETLEQRVNERTRELASAKQEADTARQQAETANQAKSDFLASMSHEIRTPLHGVLGLANLLLDSPDVTDEQQHKLTRLQSAGAALLTIVNDILDFSKIEAGRIELEKKPFRLPSLIDNALSIVRPEAEAKGLQLTVALRGLLPDGLVGDEARLRQVLLNLLNNAIKFTPKGAVALEIEGKLEPGARCHLRVAVKDTGIGIPADQLHRLFDRFSQVDSSLGRRFGGTGLGLAISKRLVELMGGAIAVSSREGVGSTFTFDVALPLVGATVSETPAQPTAPPVAPSATILVVDDVELNIEIVRAVLEKAGHHVTAVTDGADAVRAVEAAAYDLVFMDVQMPGMDGLTATRHIRALGGPPAATPIVAMTANVLPHQVTTFHAAGMDDHVGKPFQHEELHTVIARWRGGRKA